MKTKMLACAVLLASAFALAQQQEETIVVKKSDLTKDQLAQVEARNMQQKVESYGKWVGIGHEVGTAVNESLVAITSNAQSFSQTAPGRVAMFLVIYKVIGHDILGVLVAAVLLVIGLPVWIWSYKRYIPHKFLVSIEEKEDEKGKKVKVSHYDYGYGAALDEDKQRAKNSYRQEIGAASFWAGMHWVILGVYTIVALVAIFA